MIRQKNIIFTIILSTYCINIIPAMHHRQISQADSTTSYSSAGSSLYPTTQAQRSSDSFQPIDPAANALLEAFRKALSREAVNRRALQRNEAIEFAEISMQKSHELTDMLNQRKTQVATLTQNVTTLQQCLKAQHTSTFEQILVLCKETNAQKEQLAAAADAQHRTDILTIGSCCVGAGIFGIALGAMLSQKH